MAEFKPITTQEEFDAAIKERIERAEKKTREAVSAEYKGWADPDAVKKAAESHAAEIARLNEEHAKAMEKYAGYDDKFTEYETRIKGYELQNIKFQVATEKRLPMNAVEFLQGEDEKAIRESADRLADLTGATHSYGFTRNTERADSDSNSEWRDVLAKLHR